MKTLFALLALFTCASSFADFPGTGTGTGKAVYQTSPTLITPALGTPASGVATNLTGTASGLTAGAATASAAVSSMATNTVVGNATAGTATSTNLAVPSCSGASNALIWTTSTGFGCNTISGGSVLVPGQLPGTATSDNATSGNVGEFITNTTNNTSLSSGTPINTTSVSLTAGDWDCTGITEFDAAATTNVTYLISGISSTSATPVYLQSSAQFYSPGVVDAGQNAKVLIAPTVRFSLASTTTIYLIGFSVFTVSTQTASGRLQCRRMR